MSGFAVKRNTAVIFDNGLVALVVPDELCWLVEAEELELDVPAVP